MVCSGNMIQPFVSPKTVIAQDKIHKPRRSKMRTILCVVGTLLMLALICPLAMAKKTVLTAGEASAFFSDRTMTVKEEMMDPKSSAPAEFKAFFSKLGGVRAIGVDGSAETYNWQVDKHGAFCARNSTRWREAICGFVVQENDTYGLYINKRGNQKAKTVDGRALFDNRWKLFLTFSDFQSGDQL